MKVLERFPYAGGVRTISRLRDGQLVVVTVPNRKPPYVVRDVDTVEEGREVIKGLEQSSWTEGR